MTYQAITFLLDVLSRAMLATVPVLLISALVIVERTQSSRACLTRRGVQALAQGKGQRLHPNTHKGNR